MQTLFAFLTLVSMLGVLLGLIKPTLVLHWGAKRTRLRAVGWYLLFTVICIVVGSGMADPKKKTDSQPMASQEATPQEAAEASPVAEAKPTKSQQPTADDEEVQRFKTGMEVPVGKLVYTVTSVKFARHLGNSMVGETADGVFLVVGMTILNKDSETRTLDGSLFKVKDSAGTEYEHSTRGSTAVQLSGGKTLFLKQCQPKIPTKGILVFEVPDQGHPYFLELSGGFWSGQHAQVALQ